MHHPRSIAWILSPTFNHDDLSSCSSFWHKCKEFNGLILPWLRFASKSLLQIFIKVSSLVGLLQSFYCACGKASIVVNLLTYMYRVWWLNATTRVVIQLPHAIHFTYHQVFYVKPSMSQTPKLRFITKVHLLLFSIKVG